MEKIYWIMADGRQQGPMSLEEVGSYPGLTPDTPVWREGMADWTVASQLPELALYLGYAPRVSYGPMHAEAPQPREAAPAERPATYLGWAIAATLCCCIVTGVVAIIYASKVNPAWDMGHYDEALRASERAGMWCVISFVAGLVWAPFSMLYSMLTAF